MQSPDLIISLKPNEIFCFGSNTAGRHGKGAAKLAMTWGAKWGQGSGLQGKTYGIPTKDHRMNVLPVNKIKRYVDEFIEFAQKNPQLTFLVTLVGCGLAGYKPKDIAPLFEKAVVLENVRLPRRFLRILQKEVL
jgi:hypothetical protein